VGVDEANNIYVAGDSSYSWHSASIKSQLNSYSKGNNIVILKLSSNGGYQWHAFFGIGGIGFSLAIDGFGNLFVAGKSGASWVGPDGQSPLNAHSGSGDNIVVLKLDPSGAYKWHTFYGSHDNGDWLLTDSCGHSLAVDGVGNLFVAKALQSQSHRL
jgi:hypothetical protein